MFLRRLSVVPLIFALASFIMVLLGPGVGWGTRVIAGWLQTQFTDVQPNPLLMTLFAMAIIYGLCVLAVLTAILYFNRKSKEPSPEMGG